MALKDFTPPKGTQPLTAAQLNNVRFASRHTILTPDVLARLAGKTPR